MKKGTTYEVRHFKGAGKKPGPEGLAREALSV
jgi:hypothetical protein